ncbi:MAG: carotenoid biosynthesis protein [Tannerellaceae bacterium]|nr:carotenoid biosynthesis protein [Tannerellaceae bacterium]
MDKTWLHIPTEKELPVSFIYFYLIGFFLFVIPFTRSFFISITALSLVLVFSFIFYYHRTWNRATILWFLFIMVSSFFLEMAGIQTGKIFGIYEYNQGLGIQWRGTPLIIGVNWLFLTYASHDIARQITAVPLVRILLGAVFMVLYDLAMEAAAPYMQMWHFNTGYPPAGNFLAWFMMALVYHTGFEILKIPTGNPPARALFTIQSIFFICISLYSLLFIP